MLFAARGGEMTMVMSTTKGNAPIVGKKQYTSVKELAGKNVGTPGIGTIHDAVLGYIEETQGFKVNHVPAKISDVAIMIEKAKSKPSSAGSRHPPRRSLRHPTSFTTFSSCRRFRMPKASNLPSGPAYIKENPDNGREVYSRDVQSHRLDQGERV